MRLRSSEVLTAPTVFRRPCLVQWRHSSNQALKSMMLKHKLNLEVSCEGRGTLLNPRLQA